MTEDLAKLYARIPAVDCIPGCTDCCGIIPVRGAERAAMVPAAMIDLGGGTAMTTQTTCAHSTAANCAIHDRRPFICRLFGTVDGDKLAFNSPERRMVCPHGRKPTKPLTGAQVSALMNEYLGLPA